MEDQFLRTVEAISHEPPVDYVYVLDHTLPQLPETRRFQEIISNPILKENDPNRNFSSPPTEEMILYANQAQICAAAHVLVDIRARFAYSEDVESTSSTPSYQPCAALDTTCPPPAMAEFNQFFPVQSGEIDILDSISSFFKDLSDFCNIEVDDKLLFHVEAMIALLITVQGCSSISSVCSAVILYAKSYVPRSMVSLLSEYIRDIFTPLLSYTGDYDVQSGDDELYSPPDWLTAMRNLRDNWKLVKANGFFKQISKLLGLAVTLGMCEASSVTFSIKEMRIFEPDLESIHKSAFDIADAAFGTVTYFVENMYMCFSTRSLKPLLVLDMSALELDNEYSRIILWWDLVRNGNLEKIAGVTDQEFDTRLEKLCSKLRALKSSLSKFEAKVIGDKVLKLALIKNDYVTMKVSTGVRRAPFSLELFGRSSQGKTMCGDQLIDALLTAGDLPIDKLHRYNRNSTDPFWSGCRSDTLVVVADDVANTKAAFVATPPTADIIAISNNAPFVANMPDLPQKGKVFLEPEILLVNTNKKDLDAFVYSNCPYSVQRRMNVVITVVAKPEFQYVLDGELTGVDSNKIAQHYKDTGVEPLFDDIWSLSVERAVEPKRMADIAVYKPLTYKGRVMVDVPMRIVMQYCIDAFLEFRDGQHANMQRMLIRSKGVAICGHPGCRQMKGYCDAHDHLDAQSGLEDATDLQGRFGDKLVEGAATAVDIVRKRIVGDARGTGCAIEAGGTAAMLISAQVFSRWFDWLAILPSSVVEHRFFQSSMMALNIDLLRKRYISRSMSMWACTGLMSYGASKSLSYYPRVLACGLGVGVTFVGQIYMTSMVKCSYRRELVKRNTISPILKDFREKYAKRACATAGIVGAIYAISKLYKRFRIMREQGSLEPVDQVDVDIRDSEENQWTSIFKRSLPLTSAGKTITNDQLRVVVSKNLVYGTIAQNGKLSMGNILFLRSNVCIIPHHYFKSDELEVTFRKCNPDSCGGKFAARVSLDASYHVPDTDIVICYVSSGGSFKDITQYFPDALVPAHEFTMFWRSKKGELTIIPGVGKPGRTATKEASFYGGTYSNLAFNTFNGMCGAIMISKGKGSIITGVHLGGHSGTKNGCYGTLSQTQLLDGIAHIRSCEATIVSGTAEKFDAQVLGVNILQDGDVHYKSPMNYLPNDSQLEYYGRCAGAVSSFSNAAVLPISPIIKDVFGVSNIWRPPVMKPEWWGWQQCMSNMSLPAHPYPYKLLRMAVVDYKAEMLPIFRSKLWRAAEPLSDHDNLCGITKRKFIDSINLSTSIGYPLTGPKRKYVEELLPTLEKPNNRIFNKVIVDEIERCLNCYRRGERAYSVTKACKKDEILAKEKCRIFYGNPMSMTFLIRKYFLPILRIIQMNPLTSECAVGINSHGPEWDEFFAHVMHFGKDRVIGGDYGKYDQKLPSQLLFAAIRVLIDFARECNYKESDCAIMEAMSGDIVFALIAFNGDLVGLTEGTHISGNSLTTVLNGICGSLNMRAYFYEMYPKEDSFRDVVKLMTYGDDNIGTVASGYDKFTIKGASDFLARYGQVYTMPDKNSALTSYLPFDDFEFLKRSSVYHESLRKNVGALSEMSIFKMLHMHLYDAKGENTIEMCCAQNMDSALREWFNHGPAVYELRRKQMREVATKYGNSHLCLELDSSYADRVEEWKIKYDINYVPFDSTPMEFS